MLTPSKTPSAAKSLHHGCHCAPRCWQINKGSMRKPAPKQSVWQFRQPNPQDNESGSSVSPHKKCSFEKIYAGGDPANQPCNSLARKQQLVIKLNKKPTKTLVPPQLTPSAQQVMDSRRRQEHWCHSPGQSNEGRSVFHRNPLTSSDLNEAMSFT